MNTFYEHHKSSIKFAYRCFDRILWILCRVDLQPGHRQPSVFVGNLGWRNGPQDKLLGFEKAILEARDE